MAFIEAAQMVAIYVIAAENKPPCKISLAIDPHRKLNTLRPDASTDLAMHTVLWVRHATSATSLVTLVHMKLSEHDFAVGRGDWFTCTPSAARETIIEMAMRSNIQIIEDQLIDTTLDKLVQKLKNAEVPPEINAKYKAYRITDPINAMSYTSWVDRWREKVLRTYVFEEIGKIMMGMTKCRTSAVKQPHLSQKK